MDDFNAIIRAQSNVLSLWAVGSLQKLLVLEEHEQSEKKKKITSRVNGLWAVYKNYEIFKNMNEVKKCTSWVNGLWAVYKNYDFWKNMSKVKKKKKITLCVNGLMFYYALCVYLPTSLSFKV